MLNLKDKPKPSFVTDSVTPLPNKKRVTVNGSIVYDSNPSASRDAGIEPNFYNRLNNVQKTMSTHMVNLEMADVELLYPHQKLNSDIVFNMPSLRICDVNKLVGCVFVNTHKAATVGGFCRGTRAMITESNQPTVFRELDNCLNCVPFPEYRNLFNVCTSSQVLTFFPPSQWMSLHFILFIKIVKLTTEVEAMKNDAMVLYMSVFGPSVEETQRGYTLRDR